MTTRTKGANYYGSELNRFIDEKCSHEMTCINIDCFMIKIAKRKIKFIEFKHNNESAPKSQLSALKILQYLLSTRKDKEWEVGFYIVRGNYPFLKADITEVGVPRVHIVNQNKLKKWLNFEEELES